MRETWGETLVAIGDVDERVIVLDGDLANSTRADIFATAFPDRFLQMGIAEQNLVGAAVGLAAEGYVPWLSSFGVFFTHRALDPIRMLVSQTHANVKIAAAYSGLLTGLTGKTHQDVADLAIMRSMPGMTVLAPGDNGECAAAMRWATDHHGPVYLRLARDPSPEIHDPAPREFRPGAVHVLREGRDATVVSTGVQTARVLAAADRLRDDFIEVRVVHVPCLKPLASEVLLAALQDSELVVSVEEHSVIGGLGGLVAETLAGSGNRVRLHRVGLADGWAESAPNEFLLDKYGISAERVAEQIRAFLPTRTVRAPSVGRHA